MEWYTKRATVAEDLCADLGEPSNDQKKKGQRNAKTAPPSKPKEAAVVGGG